MKASYQANAGKQGRSLPENCSETIKRLRAKLELTQTQLAELMGVSFASVNRWENGQARPSALAWKQILLAEQIGLKAFDSNRTSLPPAQELLPQSPNAQARLDFSSSPDIVWSVAEAERLTYGHLFNPAFASELSLIEPLPHQRIAVYESMLSQPRLRFLLADDAGAGKTIMSGLYIREMLARRLVRRVLIVPPAGLVGNWKREMRLLFGLPFNIVSSADARTANPFVGTDSHLLIVSLDTLCGERMFSKLQESPVEPYDLVIFDEAHKLSADREPDHTFRKTERYKLAEALSGVRDIDPDWRIPWTCKHLLLLTATPHMGKYFPYYCLWRLLEPEIFSAPEAFQTFPVEARRQHFIRRTKEEMVHLDGSPLYPTRISDTHAYELKQGETSEQCLYDEVTRYVHTYYNQAGVLNRSAVRLAMSVFQRRLASSSYALLKSLQNRLKKINHYLEKIQSGEITAEMLTQQQRKLDALPDVLDQMTADEETPVGEREENEVNDERLLEAILTPTLAALRVERDEVKRLIDLAECVYEKGEESKFEKLLDLIRNPNRQNEKLIIFTEFRDTQEHLVRRLEGLGYTGKVASIHGGMDYQDRDVRVEFFKKPNLEGGAHYLVATDAAGEGINLQFCWMMINYDIPWNPARLEQRMGRIHRYGQKHDPVIIMNLVAAKTREGKVLKTLLDKLELIRKELGSDKVFGCIGRIFENVSLKRYMELALTDEGAERATREIEKILTGEEVERLARRDQQIYGKEGDVRRELPRLRESLEKEMYFKLLPGYVRRFIEKTSPLLGLKIEGNLEGIFSFSSVKPGVMDPLWSVLEDYPEEIQNRLTVYKPADPKQAIFLRPGDPFFDRFCAIISSRFSMEALKGAVFVDPTATRAYIFHLVIVTVVRKADPHLPALVEEEVVEQQLVGLKQEENGEISQTPIESLLLLKGGKGIPFKAARLAALAPELKNHAEEFLKKEVTARLVENRKSFLLQSLPDRLDFVAKGYDYQDADLASVRVKLTEKIRVGVPQAAAKLNQIKEQQGLLADHREKALHALRREPELISPGEITFVAHALVVPSDDPEDRKRYDAEIEAIAVKVAWAWEEAQGGKVLDVSKPSLALAAGLQEDPGFDLLSQLPEGSRRCIEVKGRATVGDVELTENEWSKSCNLREKYRLYVVYDCGTPNPRLLRIQDPFGKLLFRTKSRVVIDENEIFQAAESEG